MKSELITPLRRDHRGHWLLILLLGLSPLLADEANDSDRIASVESEIGAMTAVLQMAKNPGEKAKLETKLKRMNDELAILRQRQLLDRRAKEISEDRLSNPLDALREKLRLVDASEEAGKKRIQELGEARRTAAAERDLLVSQLENLRLAAKAKGTEVAIAELEERVFTRNEEIRSLSLQREAAENEVELAHEADRLREDLKELEHAGRATIKGLLDSRQNDEKSAKLEERLRVRLAEQQQGLETSEGSLRVARQKLAMFDEELALLEEQTGFFKSNARVDRLLIQQRGQKKALLERIPHLEAQVMAAHRARKLLSAELDLVATEHTLREQRYAQLGATYLERLRWPAYGLVGIGLLYLLHNHVLARLVVPREKRPIAKRLGRYGAVFACIALLGGFLFDDLTLFAATLGVVSAALVISLQDVCTSVFGWFVIMIAGKFRVGDRLEIDGARGDIIDIDMLGTTFNEINGWLDTDEPTGRVVTIPNNFIFKSKVINYTHQHPYIWGRLDLTVTFESPQPRTMEVFAEVLRRVTRDDFVAARKACVAFRERYGAEDAQYEPRIHSKIVDTGILLSLYYVSHYKESCAARTRINEGLIAAMRENPSIQLSNPTVNLVHTNPPPPADGQVIRGARKKPFETLVFQAT